MIPRLSPAEIVGLQQSAETILSLAGYLSLLLIVGYLGYVLLRPFAPRPVGGQWRRTPDGRALCPPCAEVRAAEDLPLAPLAASIPVEPLEKCGCCQAYRAQEDTANG